MHLKGHRDIAWVYNVSALEVKGELRHGRTALHVYAEQVPLALNTIGSLPCKTTTNRVWIDFFFCEKNFTFR